MFGLSDNVVADLCRVFGQQDNVEKVIVFGSRAKGTYHEGSDIDLAVVGNQLTFHQLMKLSTDIDDLGLLYKVDLVDYNKKRDTPLGRHIDRVGQVLWTRT
ncbi:MAG: nucleotidyltransferase domain-containing protein [Bacteroidaceae bacterium]|nr:nucleotidyltransferase domain-containing protein [Bacteroidaceae bacterium]